MYYIINKTTNQTTVHHGDWPNLNEQLTNGDDIIVVSLYSNTIKTPYMENHCWEWKDYDIPFLSYIPNDPKKSLLLHWMMQLLRREFLHLN